MKTKAQIQEEYIADMQYMNEELDAGRISFDDYMLHTSVLRYIFENPQEDDCTAALNVL